MTIKHDVNDFALIQSKHRCVCGCHFIYNSQGDVWHCEHYFTGKRTPFCQVFLRVGFKFTDGREMYSKMPHHYELVKNSDSVVELSPKGGSV